LQVSFSKTHTMLKAKTLTVPYVDNQKEPPRGRCALSILEFCQIFRPFHWSKRTLWHQWGDSRKVDESAWWRQPFKQNANWRPKRDKLAGRKEIETWKKRTQLIPSRLFFYYPVPEKG
jgi:hypothetical protein